MAGFRSAFVTVKSSSCCTSLLCVLVSLLGTVSGAELKLDWGHVNARTDQWVRVEFKGHIRRPCVFTSPPIIKGKDNYATVLIGDVSSSGFSLRILKPHCIPQEQWEAEEPVRVAWLGVASTTEGHSKNTSTNNPHWMASVFTFSMSYDRAASKPWTISDKEWKLPLEPKILLAVQNQKEMLESGGFKEEDLTKPLSRIPSVNTEDTKDVVRFKLPARVAEDYSFELKVAYLRYADENGSAVVDGTLLKSKLYFLRSGETSVVAVSGRAFPKYGMFGVHVTVPRSFPAAVVLREVTKETGEVTTMVQGFENCVKIPPGRTSIFEAVLLLQPAETAVTATPWSPTPIIRQNGGPKCREVEAADRMPGHAAVSCTDLCLSLWNAKSEDYWECEDVQQCFLKDFNDVAVAHYFGISDAATRKYIQTTCKFGLRPPLARSQYSYTITLRKNSRERLAWSSRTDCNGAHNYLIVREATYGKPVSVDKPQEECDRVDVTEEVRNICKKAHPPCTFSDAEFDMLTKIAVNKCLVPHDDVELRMYYDCRWRSQGPDCFRVTKGDANFCTQACFLIWSSFAAEADKENVPDPDAAFEEFWVKNIGSFFDNILTPENRQRLVACRFSKRPYNVSIEQSEAGMFIPLHEDGSPSVFENFCDNSGALEIVDVVVGPKVWVMNGEAVEGCSTLNMTEFVKRFCHQPIKDGERKCVIPRSLLPTKEQLCATEMCGIFLRYNCVGGSQPDNYSCEALPTTGEFTSESCTCPNSADPCTYFEARNSEKYWTQDVPEYATVAFGSHGVRLPRPGSQVVYTLSDRHELYCQASSNNFVLCKAATVVVNTPVVRREPECSRAHLVQKEQATGSDVQCQFACISAAKDQCASAENPWTCVAEALPACMIPNVDQVTCHITSPVAGLYDADAQTCGCPDSKPCDVASVRATTHAWMPDFETYSGRPGVIVAASRQALWTNNPGRFYYENGMHKSGGCGENPWIRGVFCESKADAGASNEGDGIPLCNTAVSQNPLFTNAECRIRCHTTLEECRNEYEELGKSTSVEEAEYVGACFKRRRSADFRLSQCLFGTRVTSQGERKGDMQAGWTIATSAWQSVTFSTKFDSVPIVIAGLPEDESPFLTPLIRDVTKAGFRVKLFRKGCTHTVTVHDAALVPWLALTEGRHMPRNAENGIRALKVELNPPKNLPVRVDFENLRFSYEAVVLLQVQQINPPNTSVEAVSVGVTSLHSWGAEIALLEETPSRFSSVVVGLVFIGKQSPELSFGIPPTLSRRRIETFFVDSLHWTLNSSQRDPIGERVNKHSHVFATPVLRFDPKGMRPTDAIVLQQRPDMNGINWKLLPWKRICSSRGSYGVADARDFTKYVGLLVEALESAPLVLTGKDDLETPCEDVVAHQFVRARSASCEEQCSEEDGDMESTMNQCVDTCVEGDSYNEGACRGVCEAKLPRTSRECLRQCRAAEDKRCKEICEDLVASLCERHPDKRLCLRALGPIEFFAQCRLMQQRRDQDSFDTAQENEDDSSASQCTIVDMSSPELKSFAGWDVDTRTCKCPQGTHACSSSAVEQQILNRAALREAVQTFCEERQSPTFATPVTRGFATPENLCEAVQLGNRKQSGPLTWKQIPPPVYSDLDLKLDDVAVPSGDSLCRSRWTHVFCTIQTSKETAAAPPSPSSPVLDVPILSEWLEWGGCSATCRTDQAVPVRTRRRFQYVGGSNDFPPLLETKACDDLPVCGEVCWMSEWSDWGECAETFVGNAMAFVQARVKYVYDYNEACADDNFLELRDCVDEYEIYETIGAYDEGDLLSDDVDPLVAEDAGQSEKVRPSRGAHSEAAASLYADFTQQSQHTSLGTASLLFTGSNLSVLDLTAKGDGDSAGNISNPDTGSDVQKQDIGSPVPTSNGGESPVAGSAEEHQETTLATERADGSSNVRHDGGVHESDGKLPDAKPERQDDTSAAERPVDSSNVEQEGVHGSDGKLTEARAAEERQGDTSAAEHTDGRSNVKGGNERKPQARPSKPPYLARVVRQRRPDGLARNNGDLPPAGRVTVPEYFDQLDGMASRYETACPPWLSWSGCDAPCIFHPGRPPRRYKATFSGFLPSEACARISKHVDDCLDLPLCRQIDVSCDQFEAVTYTVAEKDFCRESCEEVFRQCSDLLREGKYMATSIQKCFLRIFPETLPHPSKCPLSPAHRREQELPKCFLSRTRQTPSESFSTRTLDASTSPPLNSPLSGGVNEGEQSFLSATERGTSESHQGGISPSAGSDQGGVEERNPFVESCECYDPEDEPCTAEEAFDSLQTTLKPFLDEPLCPPFIGMGGQSVINGVETSDSGVYFALKGNQRMHCPAAQRKKSDRGAKPRKAKGLPVTFTTFDSLKELTSFCNKGLPWWDNSVLDFVSPKRLPYCTGVREKEGVHAGPAKCQDLCEQARIICFESSSSPDAVELCLWRRLAKLEFSQKCYMPEVLRPGKGIIVCKKKQSDCTLGEWDEWSACTDSCYSDKAARLPLRSRARKYIHPSSINDAICSQVQDESTVEVEECTGLPICRGEEEIQVAVDKAYDIQVKQEPQLSIWTPTHPPVEESRDEAQSVLASSCYIADMSELPASLDRGFDIKYNTCRCPGRESRPCSSAEVLASLSRWASTGNLLCNRDPTLTILAQDMEQFHCALKSFRKIGSQPDCTVEEYALVFCTGEEITSAELSAVWLTCLLFGLFAGLACVLFCLQHSGDVQKMLGLSGSYPRLVRELDQLHAKEAFEREENAFTDTQAEADTRSAAYESGEEQGDIGYVDAVLQETGDCAAPAAGDDGNNVKVGQVSVVQQQHDGVEEGEASICVNKGANDRDAEEEADFATHKERASKVKYVTFADECLVLDRKASSSFTESVSPEKGGVQRFSSLFSRRRTPVRISSETGESGGASAHHAAAEADGTSGVALQRERDGLSKGFKDE